MITNGANIGTSKENTFIDRYIGNMYEKGTIHYIDNVDTDIGILT